MRTGEPLPAVGEVLAALATGLWHWDTATEKVTVENGSIRRGDPITSSSNPGFGMKATGSCRSVGYALEDTDRDATIRVFAHLDGRRSANVEQLEARIAILEARLRNIENGMR